MRSTQHPPRRDRSEDETSPVDNSTICIEDVDELLEEIDTLLEDQAVLVNFRQRSGQ